MGASAARDADARLHLAIPVHTTVGSRRVLDPKRSTCAVCNARFVPLLRGKHYCRRCGGIVCEACTSLRTYGSRLPPPPPSQGCDGREGSSSPRRPRHTDAASPPRTPQPNSSPNMVTTPPPEQSDDSNPPSSPNMNCPAGAAAAASPDRSSSSKPMPVKFRVCTPCNLRQSAVHILPQACWERIVTFAGDVAHHHALQTCRRLQLVANLPYPTGSGWDTFFGESTFLAKGANGAVYRAQLHSHVAAKLGLTGTTTGGVSSSSSPLVAVKVINKSTVLSLRKWRHVVREIDAMQQCRHPNVLRLLGVFQTPEAVYVVGELAPGGDVFDWLVAKRGCTESEAKGVMKQLLVALQHMHDNVGAVHRDVKPENLFLLEKVPHSQQQQQQHRGHSSHRRIPQQMPNVLRRGAVPAIVLGDFGYARVFPESANPRRPPIGLTASAAMPVAGAQAARAELLNRELTAKATPCGTLGFAPPEVLRAYADRKATPATAPAAPITPVEIMKKTDVFAAGVTMCLLLTATEPFPCHSSAANVAAVQRGVDFTGRHWAHVSSGARSLIQRMLAPSAEQRPSAYDCLASPWFASVRSEPLPSTAAATQPLSSTVAASQQHLRDPGFSGVATGGTAACDESDRPCVDLSTSARSLRKNAGVYAPIGITTGRRSSSSRSAAAAAASSSFAAVSSPATISNAASSSAAAKDGGGGGDLTGGEPEVLRVSREELERQDRALDRQLTRRSLAQSATTTTPAPESPPRSHRGSRSSGGGGGNGKPGPGGGSPTTTMSARHVQQQPQELDCFE